MRHFRLHDSRATHRLGLAAVAALLAIFMTDGRAAGVTSMLELRYRNMVRQQYDLSCGAAALATILRYQHGEDVDERDVALGLVGREEYLDNPEILRVRQGFSLLDMHRFVTGLGYEGAGLGQLSYEELIVLAPAIVPLRIHGYNHFVVLRGELGRNVLLADPAFGNRTMSRARFEQSWIEYAEHGRVAFVVRRRDGLIPPSRLAVTADEFPLLD